MNILSLGWGVQSFTLAAMSALGDMPKLDFVIHSDTSFEASWTYEFRERWTPWLKEHGVLVGIAQAPQEQLSIQYGKCSIPAFMKQDNKILGQVQRRCTYLWKIAPLRRYARIIRQGKDINMLIGISMDEATRVKPSGVAYITNKYPLIENRMTREDCIKYLEEHNIEVPKKSSCYFCPYHAKKEWLDVMESVDRDKVILADKEIRNISKDFELYLGQWGVPIETLDFTKRGKEMYLWDEECSGICGI